MVWIGLIWRFVVLISKWFNYWNWFIVLQFKSLGIEINHQNIFIISLVLHLGNYVYRIIAAIIIINVILFFKIDQFDNEEFNKTTSNKPDKIDALLLQINITSYMNYVVFYIVFLFSTYSRMATINKCLRKQISLVNSNTLKHCEIVREMALIHDKACSTAELN